MKFRQLRFVKIEMKEKMPKELLSKKYTTLPSFKEKEPFLRNGVSNVILRNLC